QIHIVRRLIHECAAIKFPRAAPWRLIVVILRSSPPHGAVSNVEAAESPPVNRSLEQLYRRIEPILLHHEQMNLRGIARCDTLLGALERYSHRLLGHDVMTGLCGEDTLGGMQTRRRADSYDFTLP